MYSLSISDGGGIAKLLDGIFMERLNTCDESVTQGDILTRSIGAADKHDAVDVSSLCVVAQLLHDAHRVSVERQRNQRALFVDIDAMTASVLAPRHHQLDHAPDQRLHRLELVIFGSFDDLVSLVRAQGNEFHWRSLFSKP